MLLKDDSQGSGEKKGCVNVGMNTFNGEEQVKQEFCRKVYSISCKWHQCCSCCPEGESVGSVVTPVKKSEMSYISLHCFPDLCLGDKETQMQQFSDNLGCYLF